MKAVKRIAGSTAAFIKKIWMQKQGRIGLILLTLLALVAVFAPLIAPYDPYDVAQRADKGLAPSLEHPLGTSITTGQDVFSMLIYGTRVSLLVGLITGISIALLGSVLGVAAGYLGGITDMLLMRIVDVMIVIPTLPLTILITNVFGKSYVVIVLVFVLFGWTGLARTVRSLVLRLKNADYVKSAELAGAGRWYIMKTHILPSVSHLVIMSTALSCAGIMIAEAGLSFLGLGNPTAISWGKMLAEAQSGGSMLFGQWWTIIAPGIGIFISVFAFMRIGLAIEGILNPGMKGKNGMNKLIKHMGNRYLDEVLSSMEDAE
ncbi:MAG: ABC transporter permease [Clostridia bacterium]|nr:ABC transporter permease [Clostridia bacterium]